MYIPAILVLYKMVKSMRKLYTFQYSIWRYAYRGKGSIKNRPNLRAAKPGKHRNASSHTHIPCDESCDLV